MTVAQKITFYKISVSICFGLLGFFLNFHTIIFPFGEYTVAILLGLLLPLLIALSWGWKYGLLAALAGGCQSMWWLWGPSNGYAIFLVVPPFTLWVVWHGFFAELRRRQISDKWWLSLYVVEIPFRLLNSINLLTLSRWTVSLNPPPWDWAVNASTAVPMNFSIYIVLKQASVAFVLLLIVDVLLHLNPVRIFFKLSRFMNVKKTGYIISTSLLFGCLFWVIDSGFHAFIFHRESSFIELLVRDIPEQNLFVRIVFFIFCLIFGMFAARILRRQKEDEAALRENEALFSGFFNQGNIGMAITSLEKGWVKVNKKICDMLGYSKNELMKMTWTEITYPDDLEPDFVLFNQMISGEIENYEMEKRFFKKDQTIIHTYLTVSCIHHADGSIDKVLATIQDITKRKKLENQLLQSQKMESLGTLAGGVAHEINNPVNGIMNYAQLIKDEIDDSNSLTEFADEIIHETQRVSTIVRNLLTFARDEKESHSPARLEDIINAVLSLVQATIRKDQIQINVNIPSELPKIKCRSQQIQQIFMNLMTNARDALNEKYTEYDINKKITISAKLYQKEGRRWICTTVEDSGNGIDSSIQDKVFDPFFTSKPREKGTGLGLSISYGIVKDHHGELSMESRSGEYTKFYLDLPVDNGWDIE